MSEFVIPEWNARDFVARNARIQNALKEGRSFVVVESLCWGDWEHYGFCIAEPRKGTFLMVEHCRHLNDFLEEFLNEEAVVRIETSEQAEKDLIKSMEFDRHCFMQCDEEYAGYSYGDCMEQAVPARHEGEWEIVQTLKALETPVQKGEVKFINTESYHDWLNRHGWYGY